MGVEVPAQPSRGCDKGSFRQRQPSLPGRGTCAAVPRLRHGRLQGGVQEWFGVDAQRAAVSRLRRGEGRLGQRRRRRRYTSAAVSRLRPAVGGARVARGAEFRSVEASAQPSRGCDYLLMWQIKTAA